MIRAIHFPDGDDHRRAKIPGSFFVQPAAPGESATFRFFCPCGCGALSIIRVGHGFQPNDRPAWRWNGSTLNPKLEPSVHQLECGWHGWLKDGYWRAV